MHVQLCDSKFSRWDTTNILQRQSSNRFGRVPWLVALEKNQAINRLAIETFGFYSWTCLFSRSKFELLENGLDWLGWCTIGLVIPVTIGKALRNRFTANIAKEFKHILPKVLNKRASILELPLQLVDASKSFKTLPADVLPMAKSLGFKDVSHLKQVLYQHPNLAKQIRRGKVAIVALDLFCMALKGQVYNWGSKWLTEKLSGKKGFSGEFSYASEAYRKQEAQKFARSKKIKRWISFGLGFTAALAFPLILGRVLASKAKLGAGLIGKLKTTIPAFNYVDAVYMSKWIVLWHNIFNYVTPALLSARDVHEFRERATKALAFDSFYFIGDDILIGLAAKFLQSRPGNAAKLKNIPLMQPKRGLFGLSKPRRLNEIYQLVHGNTKHLAYRLGVKCFLFGLTGTTLFLGLATNLANNYYTRQKVLKEQAEFMKRQPVIAS